MEWFFYFSTNFIKILLINLFNLIIFNNLILFIHIFFVNNNLFGLEVIK